MPTSTNVNTYSSFPGHPYDKTIGLFFFDQSINIGPTLKILHRFRTKTFFYYFLHVLITKICLFEIFEEEKN